MCQFPLFETLALIDGQFRHLEFHQQRIDRSFQYYLNAKNHLFLTEIMIPTQYQSGFFRCRIDYNQTEFKLEFSPYSARNIKHFQCVYTEDFDYAFKYSNRKRLDLLNNLQSDEIIIVNNGFVSDCRIGNLLFLNKGKWYSPQHYLLKGTQLSYLLSTGSVELTCITAEDIFHYEKIMMVNALNNFDLTRAISITPETIFR